MARRIPYAKRNTDKNKIYIDNKTKIVCEVNEPMLEVFNRGALSWIISWGG